MGAYWGMAPGNTTYTIILDGLHGFGVEVLGIGTLLSVRGFPTERAAQLWIETQMGYVANALTVSRGAQ
jgi:hypothetical protein